MSFNYFTFDGNIENILLEKYLLDTFINKRNNISEEQFNNDYKDTFEILIENIRRPEDSPISGINDPRLSIGGRYYNKLLNIYDIIVIQCSIYEYLNTLDLYDTLNNINSIINGLTKSTPILNNTILLNTEHLDNTLDIIDTLTLKYNNEMIQLFNNIKNDLVSLYYANKNELSSGKMVLCNICFARTILSYAPNCDIVYNWRL